MRSFNITFSCVHAVMVSVRTILEALIIFMPTSGEGAIGSIDWTEAERKKLAKQVRAIHKIDHKLDKHAIGFAFFVSELQ